MATIGDDLPSQPRLGKGVEPHRHRLAHICHLPNGEVRQSSDERDSVMPLWMSNSMDVQAIRVQPFCSAWRGSPPAPAPGAGVRSALAKRPGKGVRVDPAETGAQGKRCGVYAVPRMGNLASLRLSVRLSKDPSFTDLPMNEPPTRIPV